MPRDLVQARYTHHKTTYQGVLTPAVIETEMRPHYSEKVCILSGGSDYHTGQ